MNNVAYVYNEDTEEVEILNQPEVEQEYQVGGEQQEKEIIATLTNLLLDVCGMGSVTESCNSIFMSHFVS